MKINLSFAELHTGLFLAGKNFGTKLDVIKLTGLVIVYDRAEKELLIKWNGQIAIIPFASVASMTPSNKDDVDFGNHTAAVSAAKPVVAPTGKPIKAQVSTPTDHVFASEAGKVNSK